MRNKLYAGLMLLALAVSLGTLFFALQPSAEAGDGKGPVQNSAPPPPPPSCQCGFYYHCTGDVGTGGCDSSHKPAQKIWTFYNCTHATDNVCIVPSGCGSWWPCW